MNDISYEILDLFKKYGSDPEGIQKSLKMTAVRRCCMLFPMSGKIFSTGWS